jgi:hypothetical protein
MIAVGSFSSARTPSANSSAKIKHGKIRIRSRTMLWAFSPPFTDDRAHVITTAMSGQKNRMMDHALYPSVPLPYELANTLAPSRKSAAAQLGAGREEQPPFHFVTCVFCEWHC